MPSTTLPAADIGLPDDTDRMVFCDAVSPIEVDEFGFVHLRFACVRGAELRQELAPAAHLVMSVATLRTLEVEGLRALAAAGRSEKAPAAVSAWATYPSRDFILRLPITGGATNWMTLNKTEWNTYRKVTHQDWRQVDTHSLSAFLVANSAPLRPPASSSRTGMRRGCG